MLKLKSSQISKLASQTAIYGIPSIIGRVLNWLLIPIYTSKLVFSLEQYGIITEMYSYVAFLVILLLYGMENAYFKFSNSSEANSQNVFSTVIISIITTSFLFIGIATLFSNEIAIFLKYPNNEEFVIWFSLIVGLDAISAIALAKLRQQLKSIKFTVITTISILINISLNLFFLAYCMPQYKLGNTNWIITTFYNPEIQVGYVFISNLIASIVKFIALLPNIFSFKRYFSKELFFKMLTYGVPILIFGLSNIINDNIDKILLKVILFDSIGELATMSQIGIYGACYKLSIIIVLFIQGFRYAAEPFFFSTQSSKNAPYVYAKVANYFTITCGFIFLLVMINLSFIKYFISNPEYWEGLIVVPILLLANIFSGLFYNLSVWYKLSNKTIYGAYIGIGGTCLTILINLITIPYFGYIGSAWATLICYFSMVVASYFLGKKFYPIPYKVVNILIYIFLPVALYYFSTFILSDTLLPKLLVNLIFGGVFLAVVFLLEKKKA